MKKCFSILVVACLINCILNKIAESNNKPKSFEESFFSGFSIIFVSELGDKTFFLTMIYSATNSIIKTFVLTSLTMLAMNTLALLIGFYLPIFLYRNIIDWVAIFVFAFFGFMMIYDAYYMDDKKIIHEYEDVKESLRAESTTSNQNKDIENKKLNEPLLNNKSTNEGFNSIFAYILSLIIAEIGDKSQISAIILGAINNFYGVLLGTSLGFVCCILASCLAGNILSRTLSTKQLTYTGGIIFLIFSSAYLYEKFE